MHSDAVAMLRSLGLFWLKTPAELGGTPLSPMEGQGRRGGTCRSDGGCVGERQGRRNPA